METGKLLIDEQFLPVATKLIESAEHRIYISTFKAELTTKPRGRRLMKLFDTTFEQSRLGLDVRFLLSRRENYGHIPLTNLNAVRELKAHTVKVRHLLNSRLCHAKIIVVDNLVAIIGSHNLSLQSCHRNFEVSYLIEDAYIVGQLIGVFEYLWDNCKKA